MMVNFTRIKAAMSKQQLREYTIQKVLLFAESGDAEKSISIAIERGLCIVEAPTKNLKG